jgi:hypothetical protein
MIISDLQHIESATEATVNGGFGAYTGVDVSANGGTANANGYANAYGQNTGSNVLTGTRAAKGNGYELSAATGAATAWSISYEGGRPQVSTSVSTGVATSVNTF